MKKNIFITGASGLLGTALVKTFSQSGFNVLAQYHTRITLQDSNCRWVQGDFSTLDTIHRFLEENKTEISQCSYLINNYGPIVSKPIPELTAADFYSDYHDNLVTPFEIITYMLWHADLKSVVNIGFEYVGEIRPFKKILTYAAAKNALQLLTVSFAQQYPEIQFKLFKPPTLEGAVVKRPDASPVSPEIVACQIFDLMVS